MRSLPYRFEVKRAAHGSLDRKRNRSRRVGNSLAVRADARGFIDESQSLCLVLGQRTLEIRHFEAQMVNSRPTLGEKSRNRAVARGWNQQFEVGGAGGEESGTNPLVGHLFDGGGAGAEECREGGDGRVEVRHGDADVIQLANALGHGGSLGWRACSAPATTRR